MNGVNTEWDTLLRYSTKVGSDLTRKKQASTLAYFGGASETKKKGSNEIDTCGKFHKHVTQITYGPCKISSTIIPLHALPAGCMKCSIFQDGQVYSDAAVSYKLKMFMKLTPGFH